MNRQAALVSLVLTAAFLFVRELKFQYCLPYCFSSVQWSWQNIRNSNPTPVSLRIIRGCYRPSVTKMEE
jgi:hypothetical protein